MLAAAAGGLVAGVLSTLILLYVVAIVLVIAFSWFPQPPGSPPHPIFVFLRRVTDPVLEPLRRVLPPIGGVLDLSPTIVLVVLLYVRSRL